MKITIREAIKLFPALLDESVTYGMLAGNSFQSADKVTLQFVGNGSYRTQELWREGVTEQTTSKTMYRPQIC